MGSPFVRLENVNSGDITVKSDEKALTTSYNLNLRDTFLRHAKKR